MADAPLNLHALALDAIQQIDFSKPGWPKAMEAIIARAHTAAAIAAIADRAGVKVDSGLFKGLSKAERSVIKAVVQKQLDYLKGFVAAAPNMSEAQIKARATLYAGAVKGTFSQTRYPSLPFHPADGGTPCLTNCKCSWNDQGGGVYLWTLHADEHCSGCVTRQSGNPYRAQA